MDSHNEREGPAVDAVESKGKYLPYAAINHRC
jgi:hypothetical protein